MALGINRSSYYYWLNHHTKNENKKVYLYQQIILIYSNSKGIYGSPKITASLINMGFSISISTVSRAMNNLGIKSLVTKKFPKKISRITGEEKKKIINLIKSLNITHINQVWTTDITYIKTINEGTFYLISFIDYFSKKIVAWNLFNKQTSKQVITVLKDAIQKRKPNPGIIIHSDKGSQLRSKEYRKFLSNNNMVFSYTSLNHSCDENAAQESFHASLKKEWLYQMKLYNYEDAYREIFNYIEGFYNPIRIHSSIGYMSPIDFEKSLQNSKTPSKSCPKY